MEMIQNTQFITDSKGSKTFAIIPIDKYQDLKYNNANLKEENIPNWHKEILDKDLKLLDKDLQDDNLSSNSSWEELKEEIKTKYGY